MAGKNTDVKLSVLTPEEAEMFRSLEDPVNGVPVAEILDSITKSMRGRGLCDGTWD